MDLLLVSSSPQGVFSPPLKPRSLKLPPVISQSKYTEINPGPAHWSVSNQTAFLLYFPYSFSTSVLIVPLTLQGWSNSVELSSPSCPFHSETFAFLLSFISLLRCLNKGFSLPFISLCHTSACPSCAGEGFGASLVRILHQHPGCSR